MNRSNRFSVSTALRGLTAALALALAPAAGFAADAPANPNAVATSAPADAPAARDVLRKAMEPVVDVFSKEPKGASKAFYLKATVVASNAQPPELQGAKISFYCQPAEKALFQFLALGSVVTVCRQGQTFWVAPADKLAPLLAKVQAKPPTKEDKEAIAPLRLKIPTTLFWVLFRFVSVKDAGSADLGGVACRRVDVKPPDSDDKNGFMRVWVRQDTNAPARMDWRGTDSQSTITIDEAKFVKSLPDETFDPAWMPESQRLAVPADRFRPLMTLIGKEEETRRKKQIQINKAAAAGKVATAQ